RIRRCSAWSDSARRCSTCCTVSTSSSSRSQTERRAVAETSAVESGFDPLQHLLLVLRDPPDAEETTGRRGDHLREADDLVLEQAVLLVVELRRERLDV